MDAAHTLKKIALFLAAALLVAGAASAQSLVVSPTSITFAVGQPFTQAVSVTSSDGSSIPFTVTKANGGSWYTVTPGSGSAGATALFLNVTKQTDCTNTAAGCSTKFTITPTNAAIAAVDVAVVNSSTPGGPPGGSTSLTPSQSTVSLSAANGGVASTSISISTASTSAISLSTSVNATWLIASVSPASVISGSSAVLTIAGVASGFVNTTLTGTVTVTPSTGTALSIPVTFVIGTGSGTATTGSVVANASSLQFQYPSGTLVSFLTISSTVATSYNALASTASGGSWLLVNGATVATGQPTNSAGVTNLVVSINTTVAGTLATNTSYSGTITLSNAASSTDITTIPVTLTVGSGGTISGGFASPNQLNFSYQSGQPRPPCQFVLVPTAGDFTVSLTSGAPFFTSGNFTGPGAVQVCAVQGQSAGTQSATMTLQSSGAGLLQLVPLTLTVYTNPVVNVQTGVAGDIVCTYQAGVSGCNSTILTATASDGSAMPLVVTPSASWISVSGTATATPGQFTVTLDPTALPNGMNTGTITVTATGAANSPFSVPIAVFVIGNSGGGTAQLTVSPSTVSLSSSQTTQSVTVNAVNGGSTFFAIGIPSTCPWLTATPTSANTPNSTVIFIGNPNGLTSTQTCSVSLTANGVTQNLSVTLTIGSGGTTTLTSDKATLTFTTPQGATTPPASQTIHITTTGTVGVTSSATSSGWLSVSPSNGNAPIDFTVSINPAGLTANTYNGSITITPAAGGTALTVPVTLTVTAAQSVSVDKTTLSFSVTLGNGNPAVQTVNVTGSGANLPFTAQATSTGNWLSVNPTSGTAGTSPIALTVSVDATNLTPSQTPYTGTIVVTGTSPATGTTTINVSFTVTAPLPRIDRVTNGASFNTGNISAGEVLTLFGSAMGPSTLTTASVSGGLFPTVLANVQVTVGGFLAPLIYVRNDQIAAIVPYEINRPAFIANPAVIVRFSGQTSNGVTLSQVATAPGIFTLNASGSGPGAIIYPNGGNSAAKGDTIALYLTGEGQTTPTGVSGRVTSVTPPYPQPVSGAPTVTIGGQPAQVVFFGEAPGIVAGVMQLNVVVPLTAASGDVPVVVTIAGASSQTNANGIGTVTITVR